MPASTIDRLLGNFDRSNGLALNGRTVIMVDEAAMVEPASSPGSSAHADAARTKVVLIGYPGQLPEIDAGGAFRGLQHRLGATGSLYTIASPEAWERVALAELRAGDP